MADEKTGAVRFVGDPNTNCIEAQQYRDDNSATMNPGDVIEGIPESMLKRFLLNADFVAEDPVAVDTNDALVKENIVRINGAVVKPEPESAPEKSVQDMTKAELIQRAEELGVEVDKSATKMKIIESLDSQLASSQGKADPLKDTTESTTPPPAETVGGNDQEGVSA